MARKRIGRARAADDEGGAKDKAGADRHIDTVIVQGIWGLVYLAIGVLTLISLAFYSREQITGASMHVLGPYLGTGMARGMFWLFGRLTAFAFPAAVGYIGAAKLAGRPLRLKLLLFLAVLTLELCLMLAVGHMSGLRDAGAPATADATGSNYVGLLMVSALVPLFGGRMFGPYFIISLLTAITVMIGLRIRPQTVAALAAKLFMALLAWIKRAFVEVKTGIEESPDIRKEPVPGREAPVSDKPTATNAPVINDKPKKDKPSPKKNENAARDADGEESAEQKPAPEPEPSTHDAALADDDVNTSSDKTVNPAKNSKTDKEEDADRELTPEEEAKKRLEDELSEFRKKRGELPKIIKTETPDVDPIADDGGIIPIFPLDSEGGVDADQSEESSTDADQPKGKKSKGGDDNADADDFQPIELKAPEKPYVVPSPEILPDPPSLSDMVDDATIMRNSAILEKTLMNFGVEGKVVSVSPGPVVTRYEIELAPGVKVGRVVGLHKDIEMAVGGQTIRIQAPIPGKSAVGIELPNPKRQTVFFKQILTSDAFRKSTADIPVVIGTNISGAPYVTDIAKMPHVLIAGQTGAGKSVGINALICSILMTKKPDELRLIMIDPKMVELACYAGIPHLMADVVTEPGKALGALKWGVAEMERRYRVLAKVGAKKLETFNERVESGKLAAEVERGVLSEEENKKMPFIVIVVDEFGDLMMTASKDVEAQIQRIAQLARAVGIHLIVATQRPSVDVITGKIKANLASRIAFKTAQSVDSKTILGYTGAEKLLGMGDMLFLRNGAPDIERFHGAFISEEDVETIVNDIKAQQIETETITFRDAISDGNENGSGGRDDYDDGDRDELFAEAARLVVGIGDGSTSFLQRRLKIGFARAGRVMDELERAGVVGPQVKPGKPREVLMLPEDLEDILQA